MHLLLIGASGVLGRRIVPRVLAAGHAVTGTSRSPAGIAAIECLGASARALDVLDAHGVARLVADVAPDAVMNQATDLPDRAEDAPARSASNARVRRDGTAHVAAACVTAGVDRLLAASVAFPIDPVGDQAVRDAEAAVLEAPLEGVVLRYGRLWGPETYAPDVPPPPPRIHVDAAAVRSAEALTGARPGVLVLLD